MLQIVKTVYLSCCVRVYLLLCMLNNRTIKHFLVGVFSTFSSLVESRNTEAFKDFFEAEEILKQ